MVNPEEARAWKIRGDEYVKREKYEDAIQCYAHAVRLDPMFSEAWNNFGYVLVKLGKTDEARKVREKINQIKNKQEEKIKKTRLTERKEFGNYVPNPGDPGYLPLKISIVSVIILIIGYIVSLFSEYSVLVTLAGTAGLLVAYLVYSINIYESGGYYRFLAIFMLLVPGVPFYLLNTDSIPLAIGVLVIGFFLIWLIIFGIVRMKRVFIHGRKNPPNHFFAGLSILCMFLVYTTVLAAVFFGMVQTQNQPLFSSGCVSPGVVCKGACYEPCPEGYSFDASSCGCRAENVTACGDTSCIPPNICCRGTCYTACPSGYLYNPDDCSCSGQGYPDWAWIDYLG